MIQLVPRDLITLAITKGVKRYIKKRRSKIDEFVITHYSIKGAAKLHRHALGWDLVKVPVNIVLSVFNLLMALITLIADLVLPKSISNKIRRIPFVVSKRA